MRQNRKAEAARLALTSIRRAGWKVAFHLPDGLAYDLEGLVAEARQGLRQPRRETCFWFHRVDGLGPSMAGVRLDNKKNRHR